jgi:hypothetical protein
VFYGLTGQPAFPIRLASDILQRCMGFHRVAGRTGPYVLYDPLCGGAYMLATLSYLHWVDVAQILASDVDPQALSLAERNLGLLTVAGIERRMAEIEDMIEAFGKDSHRAALKSAERLEERLLDLLADHPIPARTFQANALDGPEMSCGLAGVVADIVMTDVPYGRDSDWRMSSRFSTGKSPLWEMLKALSAVVSPETVVAIVADKGQRIDHDGYLRIERFRLGKRQVALLKPRR